MAAVPGVWRRYRTWWGTRHQPGRDQGLKPKSRSALGESSNQNQAGEGPLPSMLMRSQFKGAGVCPKILDPGRLHRSPPISLPKVRKRLGCKII
jgi:hypothetical protein